MAQNLERLIDAGEGKGFEVEHDVDYGAGPIDVVWNINVHPALPNIKCGFVRLEAEEGGSQDTEDNQLSLRKIEEAAVRGLRSGLDKVYLVAENEEMARSVSGKIEWLASHGSLLRLDAVSLGLAPNQIESAVITPSQKRVPEGEKIRKRAMREREAKIEKYSRPKGERRKRESPLKKALREERIDRNNRPRDQKPKRA
ncbi:hypothetical protein Ngar_c12200 [Candidatus Nitrososphaera gargensis Ga9.2]|uniref:Uncharacterized protein n=1 Tax=Nitrososphaera gargensis (strain Ga9.2) TaxID=1237085 RepID=K0IEG3_NITGG|nr:hypothetical protein [Candidatus Nitrososphaera gargensis]AFU58160.1 hypothetical protein Ngar_c12200 [Candidatus Nitrososphaera gargensis Ga9.2]